MFTSYERNITARKQFNKSVTSYPYIQAPEYAQNFNRYSYVFNNPLKYTDPSGYFSWPFSKRQHTHQKRIRRDRIWTGDPDVFVDPLGLNDYYQYYGGGAESDGSVSGGGAPTGGNGGGAHGLGGAPDGGDGGSTETSSDFTPEELRDIFFESFLGFYNNFNEKSFAYKNINQLTSYLMSNLFLIANEDIAAEYAYSFGMKAQLNFIACMDSNNESYHFGTFQERKNGDKPSIEFYPFFSYHGFFENNRYNYSTLKVSINSVDYFMKFQWQISFYM